MQVKIGEKSKEIPVYSFRNKNLFQAGNVDETVKKVIKKDNVKYYLFKELHQYGKSEKLDILVSVLENGEENELIWPSKVTKYKKFITKTIDLKFSKERIIKVTKYELSKILG